ncbi:ferrioxamine B receptor [Pasteurellaceae bacterium RH1A]|nr:ferrioxamine B receptor [Pasteurellaceae bacterium RH1A]
MKKNFIYSAVASAVALATMPVMANETEQLDEISVVGSVAKAGKVDYLDPKSVAVITSEQIAEKNYQQADEIGRYEAGMLSQPYGGDLDTNTWIRVRGFEPTVRIDGTQMYTFGFYHWQPNMYGLESVEVVKGADSLTYGTANSGGIINLISKRPHKDQVGKGELKVTLGNRNERGIAGDYTHALADNLRFRVVGDYLRRDGEPKGSYLDAYYFAPSLSWDISDKTNLTILASIQHDSGVPSSGFFPQTVALAKSLSPRTNFAQNMDEYMRRNQMTAGYEFTHKFGDGWKFNSSYKYTYSNKDQFSGSYADFSAWGMGVILSGLQIKGKIFTHTVDNRISKEWKTDRIENILTVGSDYTHAKNPSDVAYPSAAISNIYGPYPSLEMTNTTGSLNKSRQLGVYVQNQFRLDNKLIVNLGARRDYAKGEYFYGGAQSTGFDTNHTSLSGGLMYVTDLGLAPFYNYSEAFRPLEGAVDSAGNVYNYKPYESRQHEVGFKYLPSFVNGQFSLAYFDLEEKNALVSLPGYQYQVQTGKANSKGVEVQTDLNITDNLSTTLAYTYMKATTTGTEKVRKAIYPRHTYSAFVNYAFNDTALAGLKVGAGVRYVGSSTNGSTTATEYVPAYTLVDLMAKYDINQNWAVQVNASNLANKKYVSACDASYCYRGEGRRVTGNLTYKF